MTNGDSKCLPTVKNVVFYYTANCKPGSQLSATFSYPHKPIGSQILKPQKKTLMHDWESANKDIVFEEVA